MSAVLAPAGWGWKPGALLTAPTEHDLPDLPLLHQVSLMKRLSVMVAALSPLPHAHKIRPIHLQRKYGISQAAASGVVARLRGYY